MWSPWRNSLNLVQRGSVLALMELESRLGLRLRELEDGDPRAVTAPLQAQIQDLETAQTETEERFRVIATAIEQLQATATALTLAVDEGISQVERAENRVKAVVRRAQAKLAAEGVEDPAIEAEARQLRESDGDGSEGSRLPEVSTKVVRPRHIKGVPGRF